MPMLRMAPLAALALALCATAHAQPARKAAPAQEPAALRLACTGDSEGAAVMVNGVDKGPCPMDILVPPGAIRVHAQKEDGDVSIRIFDSAFTLQPGEPRRVDIELSAPKLTEKGLELKRVEDEAKARAAEERARAEADRVRQAAVRAATEDLGKRVRKDLTQANFDEFKAAETADPGTNEIFILHIDLAAANRNMPDLLDAMERGVRAGMLKADDFARLPQLPSLLERPEFVAQVTALVGEEGLATVRAGGTLVGRLAELNRLIGRAEHEFTIGDDCNGDRCRTFLERKITAGTTRNFSDYPPACGTTLALGDVVRAQRATPAGPEFSFLWGGLGSKSPVPTVRREGAYLRLNATREWPVRLIFASSEYLALLEADIMQSTIAACTSAVAAMPGGR